jgi:hypothetical protein
MSGTNSAIAKTTAPSPSNVHSTEYTLERVVLMAGLFDELGDGEGGVGHHFVRWRDTGTPLIKKTGCNVEIEPAETSLLVTEPPLDLPVLQASYDQMIFEEFEFQSYCRTTGNSDGGLKVDGSTEFGCMAS